MQKTQKQNKKYLLRAAIPAAIFAVYSVLDYLNVPQLLGISVRRINMDLFSVFLNTAVVVILYIITYHFIDKRQIQKDSNAKNMANILLLNTYRDCLDNLDIVENTESVRRYIIPKVDMNKAPEENVAIANLQDFPFTSKAQILELAQGGYIEPEIFGRYLQIQKEHKHFVRMKIIFYDVTDSTLPTQHQLYAAMQQQGKSLRSILECEVKRLEQICTV